VIDGLLALFSPRSVLDVLRDLVDIGLVAFAVYRMLLLFRGTRAMQVAQGLVLIALVYFASQRLGLATAYMLLDRFLTSLLLVVVVLFQSDIRRALMRVGNRPFFFRWRKADDTQILDEVVLAAVQLAERRIGALIVFERDAALDEFVSHGVSLDAEVSQELLFAVFLPGRQNPLHDGAVLIRNGRIAKAAGILPLTGSTGLDRNFGTRHRAALGISEETDAVVVVVSEERGEVSLCFNGNIVRDLDTATLRQALYGLFFSKRDAAALLRREETPERASRIPAPPPEPLAEPEGRASDAPESPRA
jgi:diadenylate cyclase